MAAEVSRHLVERGSKLTKLVAGLDLYRLVELAPGEAERAALELGQRLETSSEQSVHQGEDHEEPEDDGGPQERA
ncbi:MAG TPA: hypothetical protein VNM87_03245, partial [Candidatus Udaeobacter sp.]|nr:hypothetical protein [Candidatus Udaeobacter sp.]